MELEPGSQVDRYVVEKLLGRGGMASVWRVRREDLGVRFALKVLEAPGRTVSERLLEEGRIQATLRHPNVVSVVDVLSLGDRPALVLEYVDGPTLEALLRAHRLGKEQIDDVAKGILRGVRAAHRAGFVHRDLKPGNVLMARSDDGFVPKIADFGLAKIVRGDGFSGSKTRTGLMMGTPAYMAPEQFRNARDVDERADVYSVGVLLYEICTGRAPYAADDLVELLDRMRSRDYPPVAELAPDLPARMGEAVSKAMEPDLGARLKDVQAVYEVWTGRGDKAAGPWTQDLLTSFDEEAEAEVASGSGASAHRVRPPTSVAASVIRARDAARAGPSEAPAAPPRGLRALVALTGAAGTAALAAATLGVLAVVGIVGFTLVSGAPASPDLAELDPLPAVPAVPAVPAPAPAPVVDRTEPPPVEPEPVRGTTPPAAAPPPEEAPVAPAPAPTPVVGEGVGHVKVRGAAEVELRDGAGARFRAGRRLPTGVWTFRARFDDGEVVTGTFVLEPGATRVVSCDATFGKACKVE